MQNMWLWLIVAFLIGVLVEWLLEMFFFRRRWFQQTEELNAMLRAREGALRDAQAQIEKLRIELDACGNARSKIEKELGALQVQFDRTKAELDAALTGKADAEKQIAALKLNVGQLESDLAVCRQTQTKLAADLDARAGELGQARRELDGLRAEKNTLSADIQKFSADAASSAALVAGLQNTKADLQAQIEKLNAELKACLDARAGLEKEIGALKASIEKFNADASALASAKADLEKELAALKARASQLETDAKARDAELKRLQEQSAHIDQLTAERDQLAAEITTLRAQPAPDAKMFAAMRSRSSDDETPFTAACPQHLSDVKGIGSVYEQRLYAAGVGSFWELSQLSNEDLARILQVGSGVKGKQTDFNAIRADARRLARATKSLGRQWSGGAPDDFEPIEGIGKTYEKRLYDAGICTYETLAEVTPEILAEICNAPAQFKPDYAMWIQQAKTLAAKKAESSKA